MKKALLVLAFGAGSLMLSAQVNNTNQSTNAVEMTFEQFSKLDSKGLDNVPENTKFVTDASSSKSLGKSRGEVYDFVQIGRTTYDLQTNASIGRRAILHDDGTITMAWTFSDVMNVSYDDRGTGINYFDGTSWGNFPTSRTESSRTGWPSIGVLADGSVYTMAHDFNDGGLIFAKNTGKGKSDWSNGPEILNYPNGDPIWNRTANSGDIMHVITNMSSQDDDLPDVYIDSVMNPTTYSRSLDGGETWTDEHILLPGYDTSRYIVGTADAYAIDVRDSVVAIIIGGYQRDLSLWKSVDNGDNWTKTVIDSFLFGLVGPYEWGSREILASEADIFNDGSMDVLIDHDNNVHVVFGALSLYDETLGDSFMTVALNYNLMHWSENFPEIKLCGSPIDMDDSGVDGAPFVFAAETLNRMITTNGNTIPDNNLSYAARYGTTSISTHPSMSVDDDNVVYVTYDSPVEYTFHDYGANFRDIHIVYSEDNGESFSEVQNATQLRQKEAVFACQTKTANDFVHFLFQEDVHPGTNLQNSGSGGLHPNVNNVINYAAIPVEDIKSGALGQNTVSNRSIEKDAKVFVVSQNYPNPFTYSTNVILYLRNGSDLSYTVTDALGKVVDHKDLGYLNSGNHEITIDGSALSNGIYFYTVTSEYNEVTKKMNIVK